MTACIRDRLIFKTRILRARRLCSLYLNEYDKYPTLSNKHAGWNKMCRLENSVKFGNFQNLRLNWMGPNYFQAQIRLEMTKIRIFFHVGSNIDLKFNKWGI